MLLLHRKIVVTLHQDLKHSKYHFVLCAQSYYCPIFTSLVFIVELSCTIFIAGPPKNKYYAPKVFVISNGDLYQRSLDVVRYTECNDMMFVAIQSIQFNSSSFIFSRRYIERHIKDMSQYFFIFHGLISGVVFEMMRRAT